MGNAERQEYEPNQQHILKKGRPWWRFALLGGGIVAVVAAIFIGITIFKSSEKSSGTSTQTTNIADLQKQFGLSGYNLPECNDSPYTHSIVDVDQISSVTPLGNYAPPDHTLPTEHLYFRLTDTGQLNGLTDVYAPGDIYVTSVASSDSDLPGLGKQTEYVLFFSLCQNIHGYMDHIDDIAAELKSKITSGDCLQSGSTSFCETRLDKAAFFAAGTVIGKVGAPRSQSFDFGTYDFTSHQAYANPDRYTSRSPYIVCPFDYYSGALKQSLYDKLNRTDHSCGITNYDIPGTLAGNWFYGDASAETPNSWTNHLSFGADNGDPGISIISIGGVFADASKLALNAIAEGNINRVFDEVTPGGGIVCYQDEGLETTGSSARVQGKLLVQLTDDNTLNIERQSGTCAATENFVTPTEYKR